MAFGATQGLQLLGGLGGLFGGRRGPSPLQREAIMRSRQSGQIADRLAKLAEGYDPEAETNKSMELASKWAERALTNSTGQLNQRFIAAGGNPNGDTAFGVLRRRNQDDILNSLSSEAVRVRQQNMQTRFANLAAAQGASSAAINALTGAQAGIGPGQDFSGSYSLLASALEEILKGNQKKGINPFERALGVNVARGLM